MPTSPTSEGQCFPPISSQWKPPSREDEAQLDWTFCLASSLERIKTSLVDGWVDEPLLVPSAFSETRSVTASTAA